MENHFTISIKNTISYKQIELLENYLLWFVVKYPILKRQEVTQDKKVKLHFIKCHAPWEVLLFYAEELNFRAPLEVRNLSFPLVYVEVKALNTLE